ncbi:MAG: type 4a pilus biogenesis protein PilO [Armatimonadota bacterium]
MINFKNRDEVVPSVLILLSIALLVGSLLFMLLVPKPTTAGLANGRDRSRRQIREEAQKATERYKTAQAAVRPRLWNGTGDSVTGAVLALLAQQAQQRTLKIGAFRPQKQQTLAGLTELPYSVQVSGPFLSVRAFLSALDSRTSKLALRSVQIASADGKTSQVTATLGLSAYVPADPAPSARPTPNQPAKGKLTPVSLEKGGSRG